MVIPNGKRRNVSAVVRDEVANTLLANPNATGQELKRVVEKSLERRGLHFNFTVRTYQNIKNEMGKTLVDLDRPWSMGSYIKHEIPLSALNAVLSLQSFLLKHDRYLTVRRARWYSILHPALAPVVEEAYPNETTQNELRLMQIASFYCRKEQIAELNNEVLDTSDLDTVFLVRRDVRCETVLREWANFYLPNIDDSITVSDNDENTKLLSQFVSLLIQSGVEPAITFIREHPEIKPLVEEWLVLSTRWDIMLLR